MDKKDGLSLMLPHRCPQHRFEATQLLKAIGPEQIQAQGLEGLVFDLLRRKIHNEPFLVSEAQAPWPGQPENHIHPTPLFP